VNPAQREVGRGSRSLNRADATTGVRQASLTEYAKTLATSARDHGLATSAGADPEWTQRALELIWQLPAGAHISADDIRADLGRSPAMGSVFHRARVAGWIECVGITESRAVTRRRGLQRLWVRL
jgi:hypothetical protein